MQILFGKGRINLINDSAVTQFFRSELFTKYNIGIDKFHYRNLKVPNDLETFNNHFYYWLPGVSNKRYLLWFTKFDNKNMTILIYLDEKIYYQPILRVDERIYEQNVILYGEIAHLENENLFLVEDIAHCNMEDSIQKLNYTNRLEIAKNIVDEYFKYDIIYNDFQVKFKPFNVVKDISKFNDMINPDLKFINVRFIPNRLFNLSYELMIINILNKKEEQPEDIKNIINKDKIYSFIVKNSGKPDVYHLYYDCVKNGIIKVGSAYIPNINISIKIRQSMLESDKCGEKCIWKCRYLKDLNKWEPFASE